MKTVSCEDINIVFEDNHVLVVVKPQNLPCCKDETEDDDLLTILKRYLVEKYNKPGEAYLGLVHRLDRPTGGVMVFAKTSKAAARLSEMIKSGEFEKRYLTVTAGCMKEKRGVLKNMLYKDEAKNEVYCVPMATEGGKLAVLEYKVMDDTEGYSLINVKLITGRSHQIRVQFANCGCPVFGDRKYGGNKTPVGGKLALWAWELKFPHPVTREIMIFRVNPPMEEIPWKAFEKPILISNTWYKHEI